MNRCETSEIAPKVKLWDFAGVACTCVPNAIDGIVISFVVDGITVEERAFSNADTASQFAIDKMHVYQTCARQELT